MAYNYVVSARPPTAVLGVERARFTGPDDENLIIVKSTRIEVHRLTADGLERVLDEPINGEVQVLQVLRLPGEARDVLFLVTRARQFCLLGFSPQWQCLLTREQGSVRDRIGKEVEGGPIGVADPQGRLMGLHLCEGLFKVLSIEATGRVGAVRNLRLAEVEVADLCFLYGYPKPTLALLCEDAVTGRKGLRTYTIDPQAPQLAPGPFELPSLPPATHLIVAVGPPLFGVLLVTHDAVLYRSRSSQQLTQVSLPVTSITAVAPLHGEKSKGAEFLMGDCYGRLFVLRLRPDNRIDSGVSLAIDLLGETSILSSIAYLGGGIAFLGSAGGDSQIVKLHDGGGIEVLDVYANLGPMADLCVVDLDRQGQGQLVACSGVHRDGSLRIVRNGVGIAELARLPLPGIRGLFPLPRRDGSPFHEMLVIAFFGDTKCLKITGEELEEVELPWASGEEGGGRTLWAGDVAGDWLRVTPLGLQRAGRGTDTWQSDTHRHVTLGAGGRSGVVVAIEGGGLTSLKVGVALEAVASVTLDKEVSCLGLGSLPPPRSPTADEGAMELESDVTVGHGEEVVVVGLWEDSGVRLLRLDTLAEICRQDLRGDVPARSVALCTLAKQTHLLVALGDGQLLTYEVHASSPEPRHVHLVVGKRLRLGVQPLDLRAFTTQEGGQAIFAASDKPCVVYGDEHRLLCANVNGGEVTSMCPFHAPEFPQGIALAGEGDLRLGSIDPVQRLHVTSVPLGEQPRKIAHSSDARVFCIATEQPGGPQADGSFSDVETGFLRFWDDQTFEALGGTPDMQLDPNEALMALGCMRLGGGDEMFVAGTGYEDLDAIEPDAGRLLVLGVSGKGAGRRVELRCEAGVRGCVYAVQPLREKLVAAVNAEVHVYALQSAGGLPGEVALVKECGIKSHVLVVDLTVKGDFVAVGDLMRSVSMLTYVPGDGGGRLEEAAHDYAPAWTTQVHLVDEEFCLTAENSNNLYVVRRDAGAAAEEDASRLQLHGEFHLGELVNKIVEGSLVMRSGERADAARDASDVEGLAREMRVSYSLLFGTVSGAVGAILGLEKQDYDFFRALQSCLAEVVNHVGRLPHEQWRDFLSTHHTGGNNHFVDGDLVERFVELRPEHRDKVVAAMRASPFHKELLTTAWENHPGEAAVELNVELVLRKVQEIMRFH